MGGRGGDSQFGNGNEDRGPSIQRVKRNMYDWIEDPDGYATVKDFYPGDPGFDPTDGRWDEFAHWIINRGWVKRNYPVRLRDGTVIDDISDIPPYNDWKDKGGILLWFSIMVGLWLSLG